MSVEHIEELDTLNQGRLKINAILDQSNASQMKLAKKPYKLPPMQAIKQMKQPTKR